MNFISKFIQKQKNPEKYKNDIFLKKLRTIQKNISYSTVKEQLYFKHSGNAGDIIYAMPAMIALANGKPIHLCLNINQKGSYGKNPHPLGNVMLTAKMVEMLQPLIISQSQFKSCEIFTNQSIDVDFDLFRQYPFILNRGNIARWYFLIFGEYYPLENQWLNVVPNSNYAKTIIIARSQRYNAPGISYNFLGKYENIAFIGTVEEFETMQTQIPNITHIIVENFLEMAQIIAGCKLFIGNQSFPYSIAEALKTKRLLEWYFQSPNVNVAGKNGYDFCLQENFEKLVAKNYS